jgi:hypothetical protein
MIMTGMFCHKLEYTCIYIPGDPLELILDRNIPTLQPERGGSEMGREEKREGEGEGGR